MNDDQKRIAQAIVNIFETGRVSGDYGSITLMTGDPGHLTYGRSQTTLASGNLFLLIKSYCDRLDAGFASQLRAFLPDLSARNLDLDTNATFRELLRDAGADPAMRAEQDRFFDDHFFTPAMTSAEAKGLTLPLCQTVIYDSFIQGGFSRVTALVGTPVDGDEKGWIQKYIAARKTWLSGLRDPLPKTVYRMDSFATLVNQGAWDLPLNLTVHGVVISLESLGNPLPVVRATAIDPSDPPPPQPLFLTSPYMRGEDVRRVQEALNANGLANGRDGVFGPFTEVLVKKFQAAKNLRPDGVVGPTTRAALGL